MVKCGTGGDETVSGMNTSPTKNQEIGQYNCLDFKTGVNDSLCTIKKFNREDREQYRWTGSYAGSGFKKLPQNNMRKSKSLTVLVGGHQGETEVIDMY